MSAFKLEQIPSQKGRIAIVTGANTGLGFETAKALAQKEAKVILACRNLQKAEAAKAEIIKAIPQADLDIIQIDLSKLASVRQFAKEFLAKYNQLDLLINNAGVMMPPYSKTEDGFELQMGANHFGHFLLTGLLLDTILETPYSRIVSLSSIAHKRGEINFDDLQWEKNYKKMPAYAQSKLANLMFAFELNRRLQNKEGHHTIAVAAHPGVSNTELARHFPKLLVWIMMPLFSFMIHAPEKGALPTLMAALDPSVKGGEYFGPQGNREMKGEPGRAESTTLANNEEIARRLWEVSEELTGINYL
jgi:NAD(P)-dependent dehydrogenase (short-subunit alcohol dehydrogenase family)